MIILHVVEAYGGGVATVVHDCITAVPEAEHVVLAYQRPGLQVGTTVPLLVTMPEGKVAQWRAVARLVRKLRPDVIHAHSSYAGFYARLVPRYGARLVYSPHCFAFERQDVSGWLRQAYRWAEWLLSWRTDAVLTVGRWEVIQALRYTRCDVRLVPHQVVACTPSHDEH